MTEMSAHFNHYGVDVDCNGAGNQNLSVGSPIDSERNELTGQLPRMSNSFNPFSFHQNEIDILAASEDVIKKIRNLIEAFQLLESYDGIFTMKSKLYLERLKKMLPPAPPSGGSLGLLSVMAHPPLLPLSNFDYNILREIHMHPISDEALPAWVTHLVEKLLVSLINKTMVLVLLEYDVWALRGAAKETLFSYLFEILFPNRQKVPEELQQSFRSFVDLRLRNFRDSMNRYYRDSSSKSRTTSDREEENNSPRRSFLQMGSSSISTIDTLMKSSSSDLQACAWSSSENLLKEEVEKASSKEYPPLYRCLRTNSFMSPLGSSSGCAPSSPPQ